MSLSGRHFIHYMASHFSSYLYKLKKLRLKLALECFPYTRRLGLPHQKFPELPTLSNLTHLEFDMIMCQDVDPGLVTYILKASPFIHSFKMKLQVCMMVRTHASRCRRFGSHMGRTHASWWWNSLDLLGTYSILMLPCT